MKTPTENDDAQTTVDAVARHSDEDHAATWRLVATEARSVVRRLRKRYRLDDATCDDLAQEATIAAGVDDFAALRRRDPATPLAAWLTVTMKNLIRVQRRKEKTGAHVELSQGNGAAESADADEHPSIGSAYELVDELLAALPPEQQRVQRTLLDRGSERKAAEALGVSREHVHEVAQRAMKRMKSGKAYDPPADDRAWAAHAAALARAQGDAQTGVVLECYASGRSRVEIAAQTGLTPKAVKERIRRRRG